MVDLDGEPGEGERRIKLTSVASSTLDASGRLVIEVLISGERDATVLADLTRKKIPELQQAMLGRFGAHHAILA